MAVALSGKVVVITGASAGIGAATALALAPQGVKLVLAARRMDRLQTVAEQCQARGSETLVLACDVGQRPQVKALVDAALERFGRLDVMLANAGYGLAEKVHETTEEQFHDIFQVNLFGTWYCMVEAAPVMLRQKSGHIVAVSSAAARRGLPLYGPYAATKAAQLSLVEAMRLELVGTGVYVSSVHPMTTETEFFDKASERSRIKTKGLGMKMQTAEHVARCIVRHLQHPKPECWPHKLSRIGLSFATLFPRMTDRQMARMQPRRYRK